MSSARPAASSPRRTVDWFDRRSRGGRRGRGCRRACPPRGRGPARSRSGEGEDRRPRAPRRTSPRAAARPAAGAGRVCQQPPFPQPEIGASYVCDSESCPDQRRRPRCAGPVGGGAMPPTGRLPGARGRPRTSRLQTGGGACRLPAGAGQPLRPTPPQKQRAGRA